MPSVDCNTDRFKQFLSSWLPELKLIPTEKEKQDYLEELINLFPKGPQRVLMSKKILALIMRLFFMSEFFFFGEKTKASILDSIASLSEPIDFRIASSKI